MGGRISSLAFSIDWSEVAAFIMIKRLVTVGTVTGSAYKPAKPEKPPASELGSATQVMLAKKHAFVTI